MPRAKKKARRADSLAREALAAAVVVGQPGESPADTGDAQSASSGGERDG